MERVIITDMGVRWIIKVKKPIYEELCKQVKKGMSGAEKIGLLHEITEKLKVITKE